MSEQQTPLGQEIKYTYDKKEELEVTNIDELFVKTLELCEESYDFDSSYAVDKYFIMGNFPVLFNYEENNLFLAFRGTDSISNIITDISTSSIFGNRTKLQDYKIFNEILSAEHQKLTCHSGFLKELASYYQELRSEIDKYSETVNDVVFCGHSAGGALASLMYYVYVNDRNTKNKLDVSYTVTFGSPRWLYNNRTNIEMYNQTCPNLIRVYNTYDIVSYLPFNKPALFKTNIVNGFTHIGTPFPLDSNVEDLDLTGLILQILRGNKNKFDQIFINYSIDEIRKNDIIQFITSDKYLNLLGEGLMTCFEKGEVREDVSDEMILVVTQELLSNSKKILDYSLKCNLAKPYFINGILAENKIGETEEQENITIAGVTGSVLGFQKMSIEAHRFPEYRKNIQILIKRELDYDIDFMDEPQDIAINTDKNIPKKPIPVTEEYVMNKLMEKIQEDIDKGIILGMSESFDTNETMIEIKN